MSINMDNLITCEEVRKINKFKFEELKNKYGYKEAYKFLGSEETKDIGLYPLKKIIPIENYCKELPESYEQTFAQIFGFSYKSNYYIFEYCG